MRVRALLAGALLLVGVAFTASTRLVRLARTEDGYDRVRSVVTRDVYDDMKPVHRQMLAHIVERAAEGYEANLAACWAPQQGSLGISGAFNSVLNPRPPIDPANGGPSPFFNTGARWTSTAYSGAPLGQGQPTIISYSFPADGVIVPNGVGEGSAPNSLTADMNARYGNPTVWRQLFAEEFARISAISGLSYVEEPGDDGLPMFQTAGAQGVRGDVRIVGKSIDGNSGILAYNFFPNNGDMVIDSPDSFYDNLGTSSRRLRNVIDHEHGHGSGIFHVCPANGTKLMEPFISTGYLGPQNDDVQAWQKLYGDPSEENDTSGTAFDLGTFGDGTTLVDNHSIDTNGDIDYYQFDVVGPKAVSITLRPVGSTYNSGPQNSNGSCSAGSPYDSLNIHDLGIDLLDSNGSSILIGANSGGLGQNETIPNTALPGTGPFFIRVYGSGSPSVQIYEFDVTVTPTIAPSFSINFPNGLPALVDPNNGTTLVLTTTPLTDSPDPSTAMLFTSLDGAPFIGQPMNFDGGNTFTGTLSGPCFSSLDYYVTIDPIGGGPPVTSPSDAPVFIHSTHIETPILITEFDDDFEADLGWTVVDGAGLSDGSWDRGVPAGGGDRGDPAIDSDGSGQCYLTDNVDGNSDVDGGATTLYTPVLDLSTLTAARISYAFWYDNEGGGNANQDVFDVEVTDDGNTWVLLESYNANANAWLTRNFAMPAGLNLTANVQVRFTASDFGGGSVVEAGVDAFKIEGCPMGGILGPCAAGEVGIDTLLVNGQNGGSDRRIDVPANGGFTVDVLDPPAAINQPFLVYGMIGIPTLFEQIFISDLVGTLCFTPCSVNPLDIRQFVLVSSFGSDPTCPSLVPPSLSPWQLNVGPIPFAFPLTFQVISGIGGVQFRIGNAIIVNLTP